uniref:Ribonuclease HII n=1 Tax=viral metagenome TaxID=1070528 RepID=A0A6C0JG46_9ZZZZ
MDTVTLSKKKPRSPPQVLERFYNESNQYEFSLDEAGRGCLFGRVYIACVVLPKDPSKFDGKDIKDSKKFTSKKKINEVAEYIKKNALAWHVAWSSEAIIDNVNILQAVMKGMHESIRETMLKLEDVDMDRCMAVVDGNYFNPYRCFDESRQCIGELTHVTIEKGDAKYMGIAAASILAKTSRDTYVEEMCAQYPDLILKYRLDTNMGYGTKVHLDGIHEHGITQWHRKTFGNSCKNAIVNEIQITK